MKITDTHVFFWDGPFSQWYFSIFYEDTIQFKNAEQYMMYHKAMLFGDHETAKKILLIDSPREIKALGREVKTFDAKTWDTHKLKIVIKGNLLKFSQNLVLLNRIKHYSDKTFVEASPYDKIWGIGLDENDERCLDESKWQGQNLLGKALDIVAQKLKDIK